MKLQDKLTGKTIHSCEIIRAEYGRTYDTYICIVCTDGSKVILSGGEPWNPEPPVESMKEAPNFYSPQDIASKVEKDERQRRASMEEVKREKARQFEKLKKELGL